MEGKGNKIESLQGLRLILFITIFFFHASVYSAINSGSRVYNLAIRGGWNISCCIFFCLIWFCSICFRKWKESY